MRRVVLCAASASLVALAASVSLVSDSSSATVNAPRQPVAASAEGVGGPLLQFDFNGPNATWPNRSAAVTLMPVGTYDAVNSAAQSGALTVSIPAGAAASSAITSGLLPVRTSETNLGKLTLSFDHSVSSVHPVIVQIESFNAQKKRTGGREGVVYPAAPDFFLRAALEVADLKAFGGGAFKSTDPFVRFTFRIAGDKTAGATELRIDNVAYATPAFYVSPKGSDANDGRTEKTPLLNPQKAMDLAQPGDIVLFMEGTHVRAPSTSVHVGVLGFRRAGAPSAWISLKNYPGHKPILSSDGWNTIKIGRGVEKVISAEPALAYLEVRGLHIRGNADTIKEKRPDLIGAVNPLTNGNGIGGAGGSETYTPHHLRFADNLVEYCSGGGIGTGDCDWVTIENNVIRNNSWWVIYATSGVSLLGAKNFDAAPNIYKDLVRGNRVSGNRCYQKWKSAGRISDGNGIIVDSTYNPAKNQAYLGRTLIQNNLSFNNGGSGIHVFRGHQVDIINNTAYYNGASPELNWGQIFVQLSDDVRVANNILVSRPGQPINSVGPSGDDQKSTKVARAHNIYFGGLDPKLTGENDLIADPLFVNASTDPAVADFHLKPGSPALKSGWRGAILPLRDLDNKPRPAAAPDRGAYQQTTAPVRAAKSVDSR